jgi:hypothetical protein
MKMPFGKFKGEEISSLPIGYLDWAQAYFDDGPIKAEIKNEIQRRREPEKGTTSRLPKQVFMEKLAALLMECPDEFLTNEWYIIIPRGKYRFKIRQEKDEEGNLKSYSNDI